MARGRGSVVAALVAGLLMIGCKAGPSQQELLDKAKKLQEETNFSGAIEAYQDVVKRFPKSAQAPQCQFMIGYLYANHMKDIEKAREAYKGFIRAYPEHELVKDAQWELDHLGMDVNQIEELNKILEQRTDTSKPSGAKTGKTG